MEFEYEIKKYPSPSSFEMVYELNRLRNEGSCFKNLVRITSNLIQDLEIIVGKDNVEDEIIRFMNDEKIPKDIQEKFLENI